MTIDCDQRSRCIKADVRFRNYKWVICESFVCRRVRHHDKVAAQDGVRAKCGISRGLVNVQTDVRLEPLTVRIDQADNGYGSSTDACCQFRQLIVCEFRSGIEHTIAVQLCQTLAFILRYRSLHQVSLRTDNIGRRMDVLCRNRTKTLTLCLHACMA